MQEERSMCATAAQALLTHAQSLQLLFLFSGLSFTGQGGS